MTNYAGVRFSTRPDQWSYALAAKLPPVAQSKATQAVIRIKAKVHKGLLGFAVVDTANVSNIVVEATANSDAILQTIDVAVPDLSKVGSLVIRNASPDGPSEGTVYSVEVYAVSLPDSPMLRRIS